MRETSMKYIDIAFDTQRQYCPGDLLKGHVIIHPHQRIETHNIEIRFTGEIGFHVHDAAEHVTLFQMTKYLRLSTTGSRFFMLEAKPYAFPFSFQIPDDIDIPSTMHNNDDLAKVQYLLTAIHRRPALVSESNNDNNPKAERQVPVIATQMDIDTPRLQRSQTKTTTIVINNSTQNFALLEATMARSGYSPGDAISVNIALSCEEQLQIPKGVCVQLLRITSIRKGSQRCYAKESIQQTSTHDIMIDKANGFKQNVTSNLAIPPRTPPTVQGANALLQVEYQICVSAVTTISEEVNRSITFPIIIGASSRVQEDESAFATTTATTTMRRENDIAINCTPMSFSMLTVFPPVPWEPSTFVDDNDNSNTTTPAPLSPSDTEITVVNNVSTQANETIRSPLLTPTGGATAALFGSIFRMDRGGSYELDPSDDDVTESGMNTSDDEEDADDIDLLSIMHRSQQQQRPTYVDDRGTYLVAL
ncbi:hypothetical protein O0I10_011576 [Lichtheimia ornata]|uniref:Arrestin C-terminal-like domain-containing protein n=1 Tax=Lichtheimia ornata TaxID=688661 RepID=A0AAD7UTF2_9FUNG|nr:uncharacterized protein O0I10_011576 [Lichtheimia ornata]KAJ8652771.1 hypothetical protein O0I10_011576 [Lichtheimia ornata]